MPSLRFTIVDVFTTTALEGNPLAVFTGGDGLDDATMQALARETNLSETTFLQRASAGGTARCRIFTPRSELPFAGHPILGTAWVIARATPIDTIGLETGAGIIPVAIERDGGFLVRASMTQPDPMFGPAEDDSAAIEQGLGSPLTGEPVLAANGIRHLLCPVASVDSVTPDPSALDRLRSTTVVAYAPPADGMIDVRVFAPAQGVAEDPATGSAAGPLGVHLLKMGAIGPGRLLVRQGAAIHRPSLLEVDVEEGAPPRVGGGCVVVARGSYEL
jgi:trans-2,3-dihydro-3-hydroxyanthranilate isomerase